MKQTKKQEQFEKFAKQFPKLVRLQRFNYHSSPQNFGFMTEEDIMKCCISKAQHKKELGEAEFVLLKKNVLKKDIRIDKNSLVGLYKESIEENQKLKTKILGLEGENKELVNHNNQLLMDNQELRKTIIEKLDIIIKQKEELKFLRKQKDRAKDYMTGSLVLKHDLEKENQKLRKLIDKINLDNILNKGKLKKELKEAKEFYKKEEQTVIGLHKELEDLKNKSIKEWEVEEVKRLKKELKEKSEEMGIK